MHGSLLVRLLSGFHLAISFGQGKLCLRIQLRAQVLPLCSIRVWLAVGIAACPFVRSQCVGDKNMLLELAPALARTRVHAGAPAKDYSAGVSIEC